MFLLIDNYDSFTYNLWHYLGDSGRGRSIERNDALSVEQSVFAVAAGHHRFRPGQTIPTTPASAWS